MLCLIPLLTMSAGDGSLMRVAPVPLFFAQDPAAKAIEMSATVHGPPNGTDEVN